MAQNLDVGQFNHFIRDAATLGSQQKCAKCEYIIKHLKTQ